MMRSTSSIVVFRAWHAGIYRSVNGPLMACHAEVVWKYTIVSLRFSGQWDESCNVHNLDTFTGIPRVRWSGLSISTLRTDILRCILGLIPNVLALASSLYAGRLCLRSIDAELRTS